MKAQTAQGVRGRKSAPVARPHAVREAVARCRALIRERGEVSGAAVARAALAAYQALDDAQRRRFFDAIARDFSPDPDAVLQAAQAYRADPSPQTLARLEDVVEPPRQELFRRLNMAPGGTAALVDMRRQVLLGLDAHPQWRVIDNDLRHLLRSWFNRGFLTLARIDWRTSAIVLEKLIAYEAVHQIQGWDDLRRRLQADRRCFAFFHPQLPDEPLIFIEVALTRGMSAKVQPLLDVNAPVAAPELANCAMFYSITNCQEGLRGISFGNFLIKQVAVELRNEFPRIRRFATLSPIPGFHLGNGAVLERLNWLGDTSLHGMARSYGLMCNCVYRLGEVERNHEIFVNEHRVLASSAVERAADTAATWFEPATN